MPYRMSRRIRSNDPAPAHAHGLAPQKLRVEGPQRGNTRIAPPARRPRVSPEYNGKCNRTHSRCDLLRTDFATREVLIDTQ